MTTFFITGTDTDCGKTRVTKALYNYLNNNFKVQALKPVATGCKLRANELVSEDDFLDTKPSWPWRFKEPVSPHIAYKKEGCATPLTAKNVWQACQDRILKNTDCTIIEGAGGLIVPLNSDETWLDFLKLSKVPVILVVGMRLGCLNHAFLTARVLTMENIRVAGWVANWLDENFLAKEDNLATLCAKLPMPLLGEVAYNSEKICYTYKTSLLDLKYEELL